MAGNSHLAWPAADGLAHQHYQLVLMLAQLTQELFGGVHLQSTQPITGVPQQHRGKDY